MVLFDEISEALDPIFSKGDRAAVIGETIDPDHAVFRFHFDGDFGDAVDRLAELGSDALDGFDGINLVALHDRAALVMACVAQFQGSSSPSLLCGMSAMRASTSASQAWGSISLSLAETMRVYMNAARRAPRSEPANSLSNSIQN